MNNDNSWVVGEIKDVANVVSGYGFPVVYQGKKEGKYPFIKVRDISEVVQSGNKYITTANNYINEAELNTLKAVPFSSGTVVFAKIGEALKLNRRAIIQQPTIADNNVMGICPKSDKITSEFLYHFLKTVDLAGISRSTTVPSIRKSDVEQIEIKYPDIPTQKILEKYLSEATLLIDKSNGNINRTKKLVYKFRQSVLLAAVTGKLTDSWRSKHGQYDWQETSLIKVLLPKGGIFDGPFGSNLKTSDYTDSGVRVIRLENIGLLKFIENKRTYISKEKYEILKRHTVHTGDLMFSSFIADNIKCFVIPETKETMIAKADCFCLRAQPELANINYLAYMLTSRESYEQLSTYTHGATRPRINTTQLRNLEIKLPSLDEQEEIVKRVNSYFELADSIEKQIEIAELKVSKLTQAILSKTFKQ